MINNKIITKFILIFSDLFVFSFSIFFAYYISTPDDFSLDINEITNSIIRLSLFLFCVGVAVLWFWTIKRHYTYRKPFWDELYDIYTVLIKVALLNLSLLVLTYSNLSVATWYYVWGIVIFLSPLGRIFAKYFLNYLGVWELDCVMIGKSDNARSAFQALATDKSLGYKVKVFVDPRDDMVFIDPKQGYVPIDVFLESIHCYQKVFIALEKNQDDMLEEWVMKLNRLGYRDISVIPSLGGVPLYGAEISHIFSHEAILLRLHNNLAKRSSRFVKRTFDIVVSGMLLVLFMPLFIYLSWKIRRDGGSATYSQVRIGRNGKPFYCYKFRTMVMNSNEILQKLLQSDVDIRYEWERTYKLKNDPRVTPIGCFLRKTSLDELPQLWNVLKGDMSLIGPRPVVRSELRFYEENITYYYMVRPGLSGLWQVSGRSDTSYEKRVYLDAWYVKNWSLWNDIIILYKTAKVVLMRKGAY
ncbi:undecaprenyl-phosphate galactose phosphotransferase WbaP [Conservatibacter flavescens]|uniref:UDP-phosphate galactose phosphotransferase n=1 Tax=Conservatibacter flavescens TaxID=28161 RepID=A0A2M8RZW5_9PAST|nr:undecaprenyl-phosphate galactose phosphotransferase WbaP [Conservatibacter flavescens]PJG84408.1 UDP-phosphate galactose phosphotransferase [Conservatibacter flavescens]